MIFHQRVGAYRVATKASLWLVLAKGIKEELRSDDRSSHPVLPLVNRRLESRFPCLGTVAKFLTTARFESSKRYAQMAIT